MSTRPLAGQVMVLTGATSGAGLATARRAAEAGVRLVLVARNAPALHALAAELRQAGAQALPVVADVSDEVAVERVADAAIEAFGHVDTWVNNAAVGLYGRLLDVPIADERQLFEVNFWGMVHGAQAAVRCMRARGGTVINVGSALSHRAFPPMGTYSASEHALKAYTDALRMELEAEGIPVAVTLLKPAALDTPFAERSRHYLEGRPLLPLFVYPPSLLADTILSCARRPRRDVMVGGLGGLALVWIEKLAPRLADRIMVANLRRLKRTHAVGRDALFAPAGPEGRVRGDTDKPVRRRSVYTPLALHPVRTLLLGLAIGAGLLGTARLLGQRA